MLKEFYDTSLNTMRFSTLLLDDGPHLISAMLKLSAHGDRLDNASYGSEFSVLNRWHIKAIWLQESLIQSRRTKWLKNWR